MKFALALAPCLACAVGAVLLALKGDGNFGWLIFAAFVLYPSVRTGKVAEIYAEKERIEAETELEKARRD